MLINRRYYGKSESVVFPERITHVNYGKDIDGGSFERAKEFRKVFRNYKRLSSRIEFLERRLEGAARVQRSLLPEHFPPVSGWRFSCLYRPSDVLSGDYYDFQLREEALVIIVSDVIGHGFPAALTTMLLKATFQEAASITHNPMALLRKMNARINRFTPEGVFAAAAAIQLRPDRCQVQFANAGLPFPFVLRASDKRVDEVNLPGFPLGLITDETLEPYESCELTIKPGDVLLIGSDGISSISDANGEYFGDCRLRQVLANLAGHSCDSILKTLMESAVAFGDSAPLPDDVMLLAIKRENGIAVPSCYDEPRPKLREDL